MLGCPKGYGVEEEFVRKALDGQDLYREVNDPAEAVREADVVYADVWASMGQEEEAAKRKKEFSLFQVNDELMSKAPDQAIVLHCLPAHRDEEITDSVIESSRSLVFDQAENRLHVQRGLISLLVEPGGNG